MAYLVIVTLVVDPAAYANKPDNNTANMLMIMIRVALIRYFPILFALYSH